MSRLDGVGEMDGMVAVLVEWGGGGSGAWFVGCMVVLLFVVFVQLSGLRFRFLDLYFSTTGEW